MPSRHTKINLQFGITMENIQQQVLSSIFQWTPADISWDQILVEACVPTLWACFPPFLPYRLSAHKQHTDTAWSALTKHRRPAAAETRAACARVCSMFTACCPVKIRLPRQGLPQGISYSDSCQCLLMEKQEHRLQSQMLATSEKWWETTLWSRNISQLFHKYFPTSLYLLLNNN